MKIKLFNFERPIVITMNDTYMDEELHYLVQWLPELYDLMSDTLS
jgi:hypothetical protein